MYFTRNVGVIVGVEDGGLVCWMCVLHCLS